PLPNSTARNLSPLPKPPPYSPSRPRAHGRKRNERLGGIGSGPLAVASAEAETFPAPTHGTVEGVLAKASGDWPQHERTTRPKIPDAWGDDRFILTNTARGVHRPMPSIAKPRLMVVGDFGVRVNLALANRPLVQYTHR